MVTQIQGYTACKINRLACSAALHEMPTAVLRLARARSTAEKRHGTVDGVFHPQEEVSNKICDPR
jgi:hypothetical protein